MELFKDVYQIQSLFGGRNLFQYLFVGDQIVLLDTGVAETPEKAIFPYLDRLKIKPEQLTLVVVTHADADHQGGNDSIKRASPRTWLACGTADQAMIEDPRTLWELRYNFLKDGYGLGLEEREFYRKDGAVYFFHTPSPDAGSPRKVDLCFTGGEKVRLRHAWELEALHVPGHSHGHLAFYDAKHKAVFVSDAIHGRGCPKATGELAMPVTYYYVDVYLSTLRFIESLPIEDLYSGHWPTMHGEEVHDFIAESRQTVSTFDRLILKSLSECPAGLTMSELIDVIGTGFGEWPKETWIFIMFALKGHLDRLEQQGKVRLVRGARPHKWERV